MLPNETQSTTSAVIMNKHAIQTIAVIGGVVQSISFNGRSCGANMEEVEREFDGILILSDTYESDLLDRLQ